MTGRCPAWANIGRYSGGRFRSGTEWSATRHRLAAPYGKPRKPLRSAPDFRFTPGGIPANATTSLAPSAPS
jgi:hypothetical protein